MSIYKQWTDTVVEIVKTQGEQAFWNEYGKVEIQFYQKFLSEPKVIEGKVRDLAVDFGITNVYFIGIMDGINDSLENQIELEELTIDSDVKLEVNLEKLYFNMLDANADYLYELPEWDEIFTEEKRKEISKEYKTSKTVVKEDKVGRNEPCTCGSGKKYKKCCGK